MSVDGINPLSLISKIMADGDCLPIGIFRAIYAVKKPKPGPYNPPVPAAMMGVLRGAGISIPVWTISVLKKGAAITVIGNGPIDFVGRDWTVEVEMVKRAQSPGGIIQRRAP